MHILYIQQILHLPNTVGNTRSFDFARAWVARGHQVTLLTSMAYLPDQFLATESSFDVQQLQIDGIDIYVIPVPYSHMMRFRKRILAFLRFYIKAYRWAKSQIGFDVVIAYSPPLTVAALGKKIARLLRIPLALEVADVWPDVPLGMGLIKHGLISHILTQTAQKIYQNASLLLPFSEDMKIQLMNYGIAETNIHVVHNGANLYTSSSTMYSSKKTSKVLFLYAGTIGIANGMEQLIQAAHMIQQAGWKEIEFMIVGGGNQLESVKEMAQSMGCQNVIFAPAVPQTSLHHFFMQADVGIACFAPYEVLEANGSAKWFDYLSFGLPVVSNYKGWQATYLEQYECGLSSSMNDIPQWVANMILLADNPELRKKMGSNGRKLVREKFLRPDLAARSLKCIQQMMLSSNL